MAGANLQTKALRYPFVCLSFNHVDGRSITVWKTGENMIDKFAFGEYNYPRREEDERKISPESDVLLIPHFQCSLVG